MNYKNHYNKLIERAKTRPTPKGYTEKHHIVPRCMGGTDDPENLVVLTGREHFIAHLLLAQIYSDTPGLVHAAMMMCVANSIHTGRSKNRQYEWLKKKYSGVVSEKQQGKGNSQYGTMWITDGKNNKKIKKDDVIPDGWKQGRVIKKKERKCLECGNTFRYKKESQKFCSQKCVYKHPKTSKYTREDELILKKLVEDDGLNLYNALAIMGIKPGGSYKWAKNILGR